MGASKFGLPYHIHVTATLRGKKFLFVHMMSHTLFFW